MKKTISLVDVFDDEQNSLPVDLNPVSGFMFIGELASATGVDPKTIRQYEREKLLMPSRHGRFRVYVKSDLDRLNRILNMRRMGISIALIRSLMNSETTDWDQGQLTNLLMNHLEQLRRRHSEVARQLKATSYALQLCEMCDS